MKVFIKENFNLLSEETQLLLLRSYCVGQRLFENNAVWDLAMDIVKRNVTNESVVNFYTFFKETFYCAYKYNTMRDRMYKYDRGKFDDVTKAGCNAMGYFNPFMFLIDLGVNFPSKKDEIFKIISWILVKIKEDIPEIDSRKLYYLGNALSTGKVRGFDGNIYPLSPTYLKECSSYKIKTDPENTTALNYSYDFNPEHHYLEIKYSTKK